MAGSAVIGSLRVNLGLDSGQLQTGLAKSSKGLQNFANQVKIAAAAATAAFAAVSAGIMRAAGRADEMGKVAAGLGVGVDELSKLRHAADMSGVSFGNLQTGVRNLSQAMANLTDANSPAVQALGRLGVETKNTDGSLRSTSAVIDDIADKFAGMETGAQKTALAVALFGRSGASMIPMLNSGAAGLQEMSAQAERLGLVIDQKTATASERFNDNLALLGKSMDGVFNKVLAQVAPAFETLSFRLMDAVHGSSALDNIANALAGTMNVLARGVSVVFDNLHHLYDLLRVYVAAKAVTYTVALGGAFIQLAKTVRVAGLTMAAFTTVTRAKVTTLAVLAAVIAKVTGTYDGLMAKLGEITSGVMNALPASMRQGIDSLTGGLRGLASEIQGVESAVVRNMRTYLDVANGAAESFDNVGARGTTAARGITDAWAGLRDGIQETEKPLNRFGGAMQSIASTIGSAFQGLIDGSQKVSDVLRNILGQLGQMLMNNAFQALLGGGGFLSSIFGRGDPWAGLRMPGYANGTSFHRGGLAMVGERGPELVNMPRGAQVIPNRALRESGGGNSVVQVQLSRDLEARILQEAGNQSVQIVRQYDRDIVPGRVNQIARDPRVRG